jgi:D-alanyl-D-alanine carboxypeptidase
MNETPSVPRASSTARSPLSRRAALQLSGAALGAIAGERFARSVAAQESTPMAANEATLPPFSAADQLALDAIVQRQVAAQRIPGAVAGVWAAGRGGWTHTLGSGDLQTAAPIGSDDHFRIASVTKTFVATVALQLVDEGKLRLDDTLDPYVPGIPNGDRITIRQVLGMTAGIFNYIDDPAFDKEYTSNPLMAFDARQVVEIIKQHPSDFPPGAQLRYSDSNYILLGFIIEQMTGGTAAEAIAARIIAPLGLTNTSFPDTPKMPEPFARGYAAAPNSSLLRDVTFGNPNVAWTAGAMLSTLEDLRVWAKALADGTLLKPETQRERLQMNDLPSAPGFSVGYGLGIMDLNGFYGHTGAIFGYSTWILHSSAEDGTIVVLTNRGETQTEFAGAIAVDLGHLVFPARFPRPAGAPTPAAPPPRSSIWRLATGRS